MLFTVYHGYIHPNKTKLVNIQELLLLINLTIMYAVSYQDNNHIFFIVINVMISLAFIQFCTIVLYHFLTYTCNYNVMALIQSMKQKFKRLYRMKQLQHDHNNIALFNIPERTYNYAEYRDGLVTDDFK